ncbi:hypothetical protein CHT99_17105 [Sphingobacterium cellulitidis]|nr:hypothetical protein CHT99_17105 [Sphingobacterium cellulitidis]
MYTFKGFFKLYLTFDKLLVYCIKINDFLAPILLIQNLDNFSTKTENGGFRNPQLAHRINQQSKKLII